MEGIVLKTQNSTVFLGENGSVNFTSDVGGGIGTCVLVQINHPAGYLEVTQTDEPNKLFVSSTTRYVVDTTNGNVSSFGSPVVATIIGSKDKKVIYADGSFLMTPNPVVLGLSNETSISIPGAGLKIKRDDAKVSLEVKVSTDIPISSGSKNRSILRKRRKLTSVRATTSPESTVETTSTKNVVSVATDIENAVKNITDGIELDFTE